MPLRCDGKAANQGRQPLSAGARKRDDPTLWGSHKPNTLHGRYSSLTLSHHRQWARAEGADLLTRRSHWLGFTEVSVDFLEQCEDRLFLAGPFLGCCVPLIFLPGAPIKLVQIVLVVSSVYCEAKRAWSFPVCHFTDVTLNMQLLKSARLHKTAQSSSLKPSNCFKTTTLEQTWSRFIFCYRQWCEL